MTGGRRLTYGVGIAGAVVILLAGWILAIGPQLSAASSAGTQRDDLQLQNALLSARIGRLAAVRPGPLRAQLAAANAALPDDPALPAFTRQLTGQAQQYHISLTSLSVGTPAPVTAGTTAPTGGSASTAPTAGMPQQIPITLVTVGLGDDQRAFLHALQVQGPRRALVTATNLSPNGSDDGTVAGRSQMTTTLNIFESPLSAADQAQLTKLLDGRGSG